MNYKVSPKREQLIKAATAGNHQAQYELAMEYCQVDKSTDFVPEICFYFADKLGQMENDLTIMRVWADLHLTGRGTEKNVAKALSIYQRILKLYNSQNSQIKRPEDILFPQTIAEKIQNCETILKNR